MADSILDRLVHNAYRIELNGESIREKLARKSQRRFASTLLTSPEYAELRPLFDVVVYWVKKEPIKIPPIRHPAVLQ